MHILHGLNRYGSTSRSPRGMAVKIFTWPAPIHCHVRLRVSLMTWMPLNLKRSFVPQISPSLRLPTTSSSFRTFTWLTHILSTISPILPMRHIWLPRFVDTLVLTRPRPSTTPFSWRCFVRLLYGIGGGVDAVDSRVGRGSGIDVLVVGIGTVRRLWVRG